MGEERTSGLSHLLGFGRLPAPSVTATHSRRLSSWETNNYNWVWWSFDCLIYWSTCVNILSEWDHFWFEDSFINKAIRKSCSELGSEKSWLTGLWFVLSIFFLKFICFQFWGARQALWNLPWTFSACFSYCAGEVRVKQIEQLLFPDDFLFPSQFWQRFSRNQRPGGARNDSLFNGWYFIFSEVASCT